MFEKISFLFFTVLYFGISFTFADWLINKLPAIVLMNVVSIPALFICLVLSVGLADFTVKQIKEHERQKQIKEPK